MRSSIWSPCSSSTCFTGSSIPRCATHDNEQSHTARPPHPSARLENWSRAFYRFRQSWLSIIGLAIVLFLIVIAVLAPYIVPHPEHVVGVTNTVARFQPPSPSAWSGPMSWAGTFSRLSLWAHKCRCFPALP
ncbi:hypothetical protein [Pelagibacterium sp. H642]|uniref:hypothetical protein n=1 Tax=Pelagibacterium sp. H642 TaxID=1881069 RepID=UPI002815A260|nr:hypothetical protein [Pelagibacterium sp. H642]WMT90436.1 hypothetical protein NO934_16880 [Pelagibacterium sp. H642]